MKINSIAIFAMLALTWSVFSGCVRNNDYNTPTPQNNNNPNNNNNSSYVYDEEFSSDVNSNWVFASPADSAYATLSNGALEYVDYSTTRSNVSTVLTQVNVQGIFSVQTKIMSNKIMGLIFGASPTDNGYAFYIDTAGNYSLYKEGNDSVASQVIITSTADTAFALKKNWNTLELDQINGNWAGYINGTQTFTMTARPISGAGFGFKILPGTTGYANYLIVRNK